MAVATTYDTWGGSWGVSWATSWTRATATAERPAGGWEYGKRGRQRTQQDIDEGRRRLGLLPAVADVIGELAESQAERLETDQRAIERELKAKLNLEHVQYETKYLEALNIERQRLLDEEIGARIRMLQNDRNARILLLLMAL